MPKELEMAPDFTTPDQDGKDFTLSSLRGKKVVMYFYPKDDTPGCTTQACDLRDSTKEIEAKGAVILGVSPDSPASHRKFREKYQLPFTLLSDTDHKVAELYDVWHEKSFAGKKYMGNNRDTFVIGEDGRLLKYFPKVKPSEHLDQVLAVL